MRFIESLLVVKAIMIANHLTEPHFVSFKSHELKAVHFNYFSSYKA